jgi:tripartite-type tricarboxylate transporter receptor subunit TctC
VKAQRLRALGITSAQRTPQLAEVPTIAEQGYAGYEVHSWWGILAPAGTPRGIVERMNGELRKILKAEDMQHRLAQLGMTVSASSPEELGRFIREEMQTWGKVVRESNIVAAAE